jgi:hypothetical protein
MPDPDSGTILGGGAPATDANGQSTPAQDAAGSNPARTEGVPGGEASRAKTDWTATLPESLRGMAGEAKDMAGLEAALKRGLAHLPVATADDVEVPLPEGVDPAQANLGWFRDVAVQAGFSRGQIKALAEAYNKEVAEAPARLAAVAEKTLKAEYGDEYAAKIARANDAARRFDRMCGGTDDTPGALAQILRLGLGNHPDFIRTMVAIGESVSDSALPGVSHGGGSEAVSTEEFLNSVMK